MAEKMKMGEKEKKNNIHTIVAIRESIFADEKGYSTNTLLRTKVVNLSPSLSTDSMLLVPYSRSTDTDKQY